MGRQLGQMTRLVDDLLDVSRISLGKIELRRQRLELASVVRAAMETCRPLADRSGHDVTAELPPEPIHLDGDPVRLAQVLGNLLNNACKFTEPPGRIRLTAARDGDDVAGDRGEEPARFERFQRGAGDRPPRAGVAWHQQGDSDRLRTVRRMARSDTAATRRLPPGGERAAAPPLWH